MLCVHGAGGYQMGAGSTAENLSGAPRFGARAGDRAP